MSGDTIKSLADCRSWPGGWYQDIRFPNGERTFSRTHDFDRSESRGPKKWELIHPFLTGGSFLDIGCNAGAHLVRASRRYAELYGIEPSEHFLRQCRYVLERFGVEAALFCCPALDFDFSLIPRIDTAVMINSLYWVGYSDRGGYVENAEPRMHEFMERLAGTTDDLILVGAEDVDRIGGRLDKTKGFVGEHFNIFESGVASLKDRKLNYIYAGSRDQ